MRPCRACPRRITFLGTNNFFSTSADTLTYAGGFDTVTWSAGQLPTDGKNSNPARLYGAADVYDGDELADEILRASTGVFRSPGTLG